MLNYLSSIDDLINEGVGVELEVYVGSQDEAIKIVKPFSDDFHEKIVIGISEDFSFAKVEVDHFRILAFFNIKEGFGLT